MAYVDYMDLAVHYTRKAVKLNHSLTHLQPFLTSRHLSPKVCGKVCMA